MARASILIIFAAMSRSVIELLAPARDYATGTAAIDCGADAVYIGAPAFGARHAAGNSVRDIERLAAYGRKFGVRVYVTLNTVLLDEELAKAERVARQVIEAGAAALIVQDFAYLRMGLGGVEMHASTQMCNCEAEWVDFLSQCGFTRVILERNMSLEEIKAVARNTTADLECFVHGAVCVGYSGRCFLSRSMGPRSGNRGECSQPCRLTYDLTDDRGRVLERGRHLLSVQDLNLADSVAELMDAGVSSFKIEGRLKDELYVRNTVAYYRARIDEALKSRPHLRRASQGTSRVDFDPDPSKGFSRMQGRYFFDGVRRGVASLDTPKSTGEKVGEVLRCGRDWFEIQGEARLAAGDGICFISDGQLRGTNVNRVEQRRVWPNRMDGIRSGVRIYRNFDSAFSARAMRGGRIRTVDARAWVDMDENGVGLTVEDENGFEAKGRVEMPLAEAVDVERMRSSAVAQIAKSGDTVFRITDVSIVSAVRFVPVSVLNTLRRETLDALLAERMAAPMNPELKSENPEARYPYSRVSEYENVTNRLSREFYLSHGADDVAPPLETAYSMHGHRVMRTRYCIRRETGRCLKDKPSFGGGQLYLVRGNMRYRLEFDCRQCMMNIYSDDTKR